MKSKIKVFTCVISLFITLTQVTYANTQENFADFNNAGKDEIASIDNYDQYNLKGSDNFVYQILLNDLVVKATIKGSNDLRVRKKAFELMSLNTYDCIDIFNKIFNKNEDEVYKRYADFKEGKTVIFDSIRLEPITKKVKNDNGEEIIVSEIQITDPKMPMIKIVYAGEMFYEIKENYDYTYKVYSPYLDDEYKDYLRIRARMQKDLNGNSYVQDGAIAVSKDVIKDWVMEWYEFSKKHPNFAPDAIEKTQRMKYTKDIIFDSYMTFDENDVLTKDAKKAYLYLLNNLDKTSKEYKAIKKYYDILLRHQFKRSDEFDREFKKDGYESYT